MAAGKTTLGRTLIERYGLVGVSTKALIIEARPTALERAALQVAGESLDRDTGGRWVADALLQRASQLGPDQIILVDAVRIAEQIEGIRQAFGGRVVHVHLTAPQSTLAERYGRRTGSIRELTSYDAVQANPTESRVDALAGIADVVVDTNRSSPADVVVRVAAQLGFYGRRYDHLVDVMVGGQFGSEGKGHLAAYLAEEYDVLMRVGGPNAGHKVFEQPAPFTFHQLPSGSRRNRKALLVIGPGAVIAREVLLAEISACDVGVDRLAIDEQAIVIEGADVTSETRLTAAIGSTGQGVGAATARKILRTNADPPVRLARDVAELRPFVRPTRPLLDDVFARGMRVFLEGTQGSGLSLHHGDYPFVTSRDTTVSGCLAEAGISPNRVRRTLMVCRSYPIRVGSPRDGTSGPMTNEITLQEIAHRSGIPFEELEKTERTSTTNRERRIAEFDWALLRSAASLNGPTDIALSFADYLSIENRQARRFEQLTPDTIRFIEEVERVAAAPVSLITTRFHWRSIIDRRAW